LLASIGLAIVFICITPLLEGFIPLLIAAGVFGLGMGMSFPLLLSILSKATNARAQGVSVGLRTTANRLASIVVPVLMGFIAEIVGVRWSFLIVGVSLIAILGAAAAVIRRLPAFSV
jgi:MFS family permease